MRSAIMKCCVIAIMLAAFLLISCKKSEKLAVAPEGLQQSVEEYVAQRKEFLQSLRVYSHSDDKDVFFIKFDTNKSDGWGLIARRQYKEDRIYWELSRPTREQLEKFEY